MQLKRNIWVFDDYDDGVWSLTWEVCGRIGGKSGVRLNRRKIRHK